MAQGSSAQASRFPAVKKGPFRDQTKHCFNLTSHFCSSISDKKHAVVCIIQLGLCHVGSTYRSTLAYDSAMRKPTPCDAVFVVSYGSCS